MQDKWKSLRVKEDTHQMVKLEAVTAGKTVDDFLSDVIAEWRYLLSRQAALSKRPEREPVEYECDPGGHA